MFDVGFVESSKFKTQSQKEIPSQKSQAAIGSESSRLWSFEFGAYFDL